MVNIIFGAFIVVCYAFVILSLKDTFETEVISRISVLSAAVIFALEIMYVCKLSGNIANPSVLFLLSFYIFQNGQLLLLALGIDFDDFYINTLIEYLDDVSIFSSISTVIAGYAGIICVPNDTEKKRIYIVDSYDQSSVGNAAWIGFVSTGFVAIPLVAIKMYFGLGGGYSAVRLFEGSIPSIINFVEYMFMPFAVLVLVYNNNNNKSRVAKVFTFIWLVFTALCGDRTTGIAGLFILAYIQYVKSNAGEQYKRSGIMRIIVVGIVLMVFIRVAYVFRTQGNLIDAFSDTNYITSVLAEMGFSCFPLFTMMHIVPAREAFMWGKGYVLSCIGGLIPSFLDFTGTIKTINQHSRVFETWQTDYFNQYSFGFGFSLNAEAYINFGWYGLFSICIVCIVVLSFLKNRSLKAERSDWELYRTCILLFLWFTLPRRDSYYIWKALSYAIIFIRLYLNIMCRKTK